MYRYLTFYRLVDIDWSPLMTDIYSTTYPYDPQNMLMPIPTVPLDSTIPLHFRNMGLSDLFLNNYLFPLASMMMVLLLGCLTRSVVMCLVRGKTKGLQNEVLTDK